MKNELPVHNNKGPFTPRIITIKITILACTAMDYNVLLWSDKVYYSRHAAVFSFGTLNVCALYG